MRHLSLIAILFVGIGIASAHAQEVPEDDPRGYYIETESDWPGVEKLHFSFGDINYKLSTVTGFAALPGEDAGFAGSCWIDFDLTPNTYRCQINYDASGTVLKLRLTPPWQWREGQRIGEAEINDNGDISAVRISRLEERELRGAPGPQGPEGPQGPRGATGGGGSPPDTGASCSISDGRWWKSFPESEFVNYSGKVNAGIVGEWIDLELTITHDGGKTTTLSDSDRLDSFKNLEFGLSRLPPGITTIESVSIRCAFRR